MRWTVLLVLAFVAMSCATKKTMDEEGAQIGSIKEFDDKVEVVALKDEKRKEELPKVAGAVPTKEIEPVKKIEKKGKSGKKKRMDKFPESESAGPRLPEIEDSEGFNGRRPLVDPFRPGEKVKLQITYFGVAAGDATMEVRPFVEVNGRRAYHFYSELKSSSIFSSVYRVEDWCDAYVDYKELVPFTFSISAKETKQLREVRQYFDWTTKKADFWERRVTKESGTEEKKKSWDLLPYSQNIYSAVQYARVFQLRDGKTYEYRVSDDHKTWTVKAQVVRRELLKTDIGTLKTVVIHPEVAIDGMLKPMGDVFFWYTDDDRKFPVKFEAKIKIGKLVGYLKELDKGI